MKITTRALEATFVLILDSIFFFPFPVQCEVDFAVFSAA